jgi:hypothetical protein
VHEAISDSQRSEQTQHQPVHVEQRQSVHQGVVGGPLPRLGERIEVGGDRLTAQLHPFGRAGGARGVDDQRGVLRGRLGKSVPGPGVHPHRDVRQTLRLVGHRAEPRLGPRIGEDVAPLGLPDVGRYRDHRHAGDQASGDGQRGGSGRRGQHRDAIRAADTFGHRGGGPDDVTAAERDIADTDGVGDVAAPGHRGGIQRGQQHVCRLAHHPFADHPVTAQCSQLITG